MINFIQQTKLPLFLSELSWSLVVWVLCCVLFACFFPCDLSPISRSGQRESVSVAVRFTSVSWRLSLVYSEAIRLSRYGEFTSGLQSPVVSRPTTTGRFTSGSIVNLVSLSFGLYIQ